MIPFFKSLIFDQTRFVATLGIVGSAALGVIDTAPLWLAIAVPVAIGLGAPAHKKVSK